jgi:hypothetical protein
MKIITEIISYDVEYFVDGNFKHSAHDMLDIIDGLLETDGYFSTIVFYSKEAEDYFIKKKLVFKKSSGSSFSTEGMQKKLKKFYNKINSMLHPNDEPVYK